MFLVIAMILALGYAMIKPLRDGLFNTSMWVAKMLAPKDIGESQEASQFLKVTQAALMEGWLSNVPFLDMLLLLSSVIAGFIYSWWGGFLALLVAVIFGELTKIFWLRSVSYYLYLLHHKMVNRLADYKAKNDSVRVEASESCCKDLEQIIVLYHGAGLRPPTQKQLAHIPYGDMGYWRSHGSQQ